MEVKVTKLKDCHVQVDVTVEEKLWKEAQEKALNKLAKKVKVDGFREGKVPLEMAKRHIDPAQLFDEAINTVLPEVYRTVLEQEKIEPFAQPSVDVLKLSDKELEVRFVITTAPEIKLGQYKGLKIGKTASKVTAKEVNEAIDVLRAQNASLVLKDGAAEKGDTLVFDFAGSVDGVAFEGGSAQNYSLELGSGQFIPGFEDQLIGAKAGEHRDVNVTFPEAYTPELAGKAAVFACDVHEVKAKKLPELDDEFVKDLNIKGVETVEALKEHKKQELLDKKTNELKGEYLRKLYEAIAKDSEILIPEEMIKGQADNMRKDMEQRMKQSGLTLEQYLQFTGSNEEEFTAKLMEDAKRDITNYFILEEVAKAESLDLSEADVEFELAKLAEQYSMTIEDIKKALNAQFDQFKHNLKMTRIEEFLYENND